MLLVEGQPLQLLPLEKTGLATKGEFQAKAGCQWRKENF
jgi:hypothetical protein